MLIGIHIIYKDGYKYWTTFKDTFEKAKDYYLNHPNNQGDLPDKDKVVDVKLLWCIND